MAVELIEPPLVCRRGSFAGRYIVTKEQREKDSRHSWPRLMDVCLHTCGHESADYFANPGAGEFSVVDVVTKEKGWFELPFGATPAIVQELIESHFGAPAFRVGDKLWFV